MQSSDLERTRRLSRRTGALCGVFAVVMLAFAFLAAPAYRAFCKATGFAGATKYADAAPATTNLRRIQVSFDANVAKDLPWRFAPESPKMQLRLGEVGTIVFKAENLTDHETFGMAAFNVSPSQAGAHFNKLACFCFQEQRLGPHEKAEWPVVFFLDPTLVKDEMMDGVEEVTLSYSFFASRRAGAPKSGS